MTQKDQLDEWIESIKKRVDAEWDVCISVVGYPGSGKSSFSHWLGHKLDPGFTARSGMALDAERFKQILNEGGRGEVRINDESVSGMFSRRAMTDENLALVEWSWVCREKGIVMILNVNSLRWLDSTFRDFRLTDVFYLPRQGDKRGEAICYELQTTDSLFETDMSWTPKFKVLFPRPGGPDWDQYREMKRDRVDSFSRAGRDKKATESKTPVKNGCKNCGQPKPARVSYCRDCFEKRATTTTTNKR